MKSENECLRYIMCQDLQSMNKYGDIFSRIVLIAKVIRIQSNTNSSKHRVATSNWNNLITLKVGMQLIQFSLATFNTQFQKKFGNFSVKRFYRILKNGICISSFYQFRNNNIVKSMFCFNRHRIY